MSIRFRKLGKQIKESINQRQRHIQATLVKQNQLLGDFMRDTHKLRAYLIHDENKGEIDQLCESIGELERESRRLTVVTAHLVDDEFYVMEYEDLVGYGFDLSVKE